MNLLKNIKVNVLHRGDTGLAATDITAARAIDMSGWDGVLFLTSIVETTAGATTTRVILAPRHSDTSTASTGLTNLGSTARAGGATSTGDWGKALAVDVYRPLKRYMGAQVLKTGAGQSQAGPVFAIQYQGRYGPSVQATAMVKQALQCVSPTT